MHGGGGASRAMELWRAAGAHPASLSMSWLQSNIETTGYRSLKEGEEVEFDLVVAEDGKKKAFRVTGPEGAPPQVRRRWAGLQKLLAWSGCIAWRDPVAAA